MARARTPKPKAPTPPAPTPSERVVIRWVEPTQSNPVLLDGQPRYLAHGAECEVSAEQAAALEGHPSFQVPSGDWTAPEPEVGAGETSEPADPPAETTDPSADGRQED